MNTLYRELRRIAAIALLGAFYGAALALCRCLRRGAGTSPGATPPRSGCILVVGSFQNPNWFHAHIRPLVKSGVGEVIVVCDEMVEEIEGVRFACPTPWMARLLSRAGAKFVSALRCALRYRPDLYMGYHIVPGALIALILARLFRRPACYQATSGPLELEGGGWQMTNRLLSALDRPSPLLERLAHAVVRQFDSVVVRGSRAEAGVRRLGYQGSLVIITGSAEPPSAWRDFSERSIDLAFVGRLMDDKRPDRFIAVAAALVKEFPRLRAVVIGDGPEANALKSQVRSLGIEPNVEFLGKRSDVNDLLATARVFMLPSRSEGVSIAMLEAMAAGAVPVVANVGDLGDAVQNEVNGFLVTQDDLEGYARAASRLLSRADVWRRFAGRAHAFAVATSGIDAIAGRWQSHLRVVMAQAHPAAAIYADR